MLCTQHMDISYKFAAINCWQIFPSRQYHVNIFSNTLVIGAHCLCCNLLPLSILLSITSSRVYKGYTRNRDDFIDSTSVAGLIFFFPLVSNYQPVLDSHNSDEAHEIWLSVQARAIKPSNSSIQWWQGPAVNEFHPSLSGRIYERQQFIATVTLLHVLLQMAF